MLELTVTLDGGIVLLLAVALLIGGVGTLVSAGLSIWKMKVERRLKKKESE